MSVIAPNEDHLLVVGSVRLLHLHVEDQLLVLGHVKGEADEVDEH